VCLTCLAFESRTALRPASLPECLNNRRKSDATKLEIAARLRRETTLPIKTISARLRLGSSKAAKRSLHSHMRTKATTPVAHAKLRDMTNATSRSDPNYGLTLFSLFLFNWSTNGITVQNVGMVPNEEREILEAELPPTTGAHIFGCASPCFRVWKRTNENRLKAFTGFVRSFVRYLVAQW
jgi:hypothetical protein